MVTTGKNEDRRGILLTSTTVAQEINYSPQLVSHQQTMPRYVQHSLVSGEQFTDQVAQGTRLFYANENHRGDGEKASNSYEPDPAEHYDMDGKQIAPWQRVKWTNSMVELLIDLMHSVGENRGVDNSIGDKRKSSFSQRKGKWRLVSTMMNKKGCYVSPQQCEDKFNDLNKRYKRLNDILGKDTASAVVCNPNIVDSLTNISTTAKDEAKKILTSKHTFYKEMHSFYNSRSKNIANTLGFNSDENMKTDSKKCELTESNEQSSEENEYLGSQNEYSGSHSERSDQTLRNLMPSSFISEVSVSQGKEQKILLACKMLQLEEQKVRLEAQALELRKQQFEWGKQIAEKDAELCKMREDNKRMKFENEQLLFRLKQRELELENRRKLQTR